MSVDISESLIRSILKGKPADADVPAWLIRQLGLLKEVRSGVANADSIAAKAESERNRLLNEAARIRQDAQDRCRHWETVYHNDPAGGSDSWTECVLCGRSV